LNFCENKTSEAGIGGIVKKRQKRIEKEQGEEQGGYRKEDKRR